MGSVVTFLAYLDVPNSILIKNPKLVELYKKHSIFRIIRVWGPVLLSFLFSALPAVSLFIRPLTAAKQSTSSTHYARSDHNLYPAVLFALSPSKHEQRKHYVSFNDYQKHTQKMRIARHESHDREYI